jgi:pimeloyl-ACP methyl ester carboxylesterase
MLFELILLGGLAALFGTGALYARLGSRRDAVRFPPPGRLVEIGGRRVHVVDAGRGSPTVVLEAGISATSLSWWLVQAGIAQFSRVIAYDRAGLGWSDPGRVERTPSAIARELRAVLSAAGAPPPYIIAGHSFGGLVAQSFAGAYRGETAGIVLVDPLPASDWHPLTPERARMLRRAIVLSRRGALLGRIGVVRGCLALASSGRGVVPKLAGHLASGRAGSNFMSRMAGEIRKLPPGAWPVVASHWSNPKSFDAMAEHLRSLPESARELCSAAPLDMPATVITAAHVTYDPAPLLPHARRIVAEGSGHWVQLDQPELVVEAIREWVQSIRARGSYASRPN